MYIKITMRKTSFKYIKVYFSQYLQNIEYKSDEYCPLKIVIQYIQYLYIYFFCILKFN